MTKEIYKLAKELEAKELKRIGWRACPVWGYFRDKAERIINN